MNIFLLERDHDHHEGQNIYVVFESEKLAMMQIEKMEEILLVGDVNEND